jgi:hypothetical protein
MSILSSGIYLTALRAGFSTDGRGRATRASRGGGKIEEISISLKIAFCNFLLYS